MKDAPMTDPEESPERAAVELTQQLVRMNTVNPPGNEAACMDLLAEILEAAGFQIARHDFAPGRPNLIARLDGGGDRPPLCFAGHVDTVPVGSVPWNRAPFSGDIVDGRLYGRGSSDMKAGIAAMATAAAASAADARRRGTGLMLVIVPAEETGCQGSFDLAEHPELLGPAGAMVVPEPTANLPMVGHKGAFWLRARTRGVSAHGSMPERGENAIYKLARAISVLETFDLGLPPHPHLGPPTLNVGIVSGGVTFNTVPDAAECGVDIRTIPDLDGVALHARLAEALGPEVELERRLNVPALWTDPEDPWVQSVFDRVAPILGQRPEVRAVTYFTDGAALRRAFGDIPTLICGPGEPGLAHQIDEYCEVAKIEQAVAMYRAMMTAWGEP
jgi:succinyl-diaminopimelate desuccinylase